VEQRVSCGDADHLRINQYCVPGISVIARRKARRRRCRSAAAAGQEQHPGLRRREVALEDLESAPSRRGLFFIVWLLDD